MEEDSDMGGEEEDRDMGGEEGDGGRQLWGRGGRWRKTAIWGARREMEEDSDMGRDGGRP